MMSKNLIARLAVAAVAIPIILWISYQGGRWLFGMVLLFALIAVSEFLVNEGFPPKGGIFWTGFLAVGFLLVALMDIDFLRGFVGAVTEGVPASTVVLIVLVFFFTLSAMMFAIGHHPPKELYRRHSRLVWGVIYIGLLYPFVFLVGKGSGDISGGDSLLFLFGVLWVGDTAAMGIGSWLGKHQLAPGVSPRKTIEGFIGGIIGAMAIGLILYFWRFQAVGLFSTMVLAVGCSVFGQLGDLVESMWKRSLGIKDSSVLIPGHGGVLDRFDSLLFAAPFMYAFFHLLR